VPYLTPCLGSLSSKIPCRAIVAANHQVELVQTDREADRDEVMCSSILPLNLQLPVTLKLKKLVPFTWMKEATVFTWLNTAATITLVPKIGAATVQT